MRRQSPSARPHRIRTRCRRALAGWLPLLCAGLGGCADDPAVPEPPADAPGIDFAAAVDTRQVRAGRDIFRFDDFGNWRSGRIRCA